MTQTYQALEGELSIRGQATASRTGDINAVALVGGYDSANAASGVTAGEAEPIDDPTTASETFGTSELPRAAQAVSANGVGTIYGVPVPETDATETVSSSSSATLSSTPAFDPNVHPDHDITIAEDTSGDGTYDTDVDVTVVYDTDPSTPSESDSANVNPINGSVEFDSSGDYEIQYTHGDYSTAIDEACSLVVSDVVTLTESPSVKATFISELADRATDFDFLRGYVGARPEIDSTAISSYTPDEEDWRLVEVAPSRGTGADGAVRTASAVGGFIASQPIGPDGSGLYDEVNGLTSLNTTYRPSEVKGFDGVTALTRNAEIGTAQTTSSEAQFEPIYAVEIIDQVALDLFSTARDYAGGPQDTAELETLLEIQCQSASDGNPPLLGFGDGRDDDPYDVNVQLGADPGTANAGVTIVPYPIAETVNLSITVSDGFVEFGGAN